jgi:uncharacterized protein (TIGR00156 family)
MQKEILFSALLALLPMAACPQGAAAAESPGGGFSGPGVAPVTVRQAMTMRDDGYVILRGNITRHLGKNTYLFTDATGDIHVEIDPDRWGGQTVTPQDVVEVYGEIDKDWNSVEIDVDRISMVK